MGCYRPPNGECMGRREEKKQRTRAAIAAAAAELFARQGFEATRTREIAEAAGIAEGTLFNYAPTKEAVVVLLWKSKVSELIEEGFARAGEADTPEAAIEALFAPLFAFYAADLDLARVFLEQVARANDADLRALDEVFVARLGLLLAPWAGLSSIAAAMNVFAAYLFAVMGLVGERLDPASAREVFRQMVALQRKGWG